MVERTTIKKKTGKQSKDVAYGITSRSKKKKISIARTMRNLCFNIRAIFDYLKMTRNSCAFTRV